MKEIDLKEYLVLIWSKIWWIAIFTICCVLLATYSSYYLLTPQYQTFTTLMVGSPPGYGEKIQYSDILLNQQLVSTYSEIAKSRLVSKEVIENLRLDLTYEQLNDKTEMSLVKDTEIIKIIITDTSPDTAARIANEMARVLTKHIAKIMKVENIQIIDLAQVPLRSVSPKPLLNMAIAGVLGISVSTLYIFIKESFRNTLNNTADIERHLKLPVLAVIPFFKETENIFNKKPLQIEEAFKILKMNIQYLSDENEIKSFAVTSTGPTEGKTTVLANLAMTIAQSGKRVLVVDCDLRKPRIYQYFGLENKEGLVNVLTEDIDYRQLIWSISNGTFDILTSGPLMPNPDNLLGSNKMKRFIKQVEEDYDFVLIDTPPVGLIAEAVVLSTIVGGTLLVCLTGKTDINDAQKILELLKRVNTRIIGVVLNGIKINLGKYYYYS